MTDRREGNDPNGMGHRNNTALLWLSLALVVAVPLGVSVVDFLYDVAGPAPDFTLTSTGYEDGVQGENVTFHLSDYQGKTVLLDFMAVTCTSCRILTDEVLKPVYDEYGGRDDFVILSVDTWADPETGSATFGGETWSELVALQKSEDVPWRHALDTDKVYLKYTAIALPKIVLVNPEGAIVLEKTGIPPLADVTDAIDESLAGTSQGISVLRVGLLGLAVVAGVASFFSPCSVGLLPAYLGFLLQGSERRSGAQTLRAGLTTALGVVTVYGGLALLFWILDMVGYGAALRNALPRFAPVVGGLLIVLGVLMFFKVSWDWLARRIGLGHVDGRRGFYAFGVGYGLAAFGCTGPIFLPLLLAGFLEGPGVGFAVFALYALSIASFILVAAGLVASGQQTRLRTLLSNTGWITKASALLLVGAGLYLLWFDASAGIL